MNQATEKLIADLEASGFDMKSMREQASKNPLLDREADSILGGGVLRRQEFTTLKTSMEEETKRLQQQVLELAAGQDNLANFQPGTELYKAALEVIEIQRQNLEAAGYSPEEIRALSLKQETELKAAISKGKELESAGGEREMPNKDESDFVRASELNTVLGNVAGGSLIGSLRAQHQIRRAESLGIEVTDELVAKYEQNLLKGLRDGKGYDAIADETFGIAAKMEEKRKQQYDTDVDTKVREKVAEALRDAGVSTTQTKMRKDRSIYATINRHNTSASGVKEGEEATVIEGSAGTKAINGLNVPVNKHGEVEFYRMRGTKPERVANSVDALNRLEETRPELFDDMF